MSVKKQAGGFIYGILDPNTSKYIFVGNSYTPWRSIQRHLKDSSNKSLKIWAKQLLKEHPFIDLLSDVIVNRWTLAKDNGLLLEEIPFEEPPVPQGKFRLKWTILGFENEDYSFIGTADQEVEKGTVKDYLIQKLTSEGHPLLNGKSGRRRKPTVTFS